MDEKIRNNQTAGKSAALSVLRLLPAALFLLLLLSCSETPGNPSHLPVSMPAVQDPACSGIIRFHIKANSDTAEDQALKLEVRNAVLAKVQGCLADCIARETNRLETASEGTASSPEAFRLQVTRQWLEENLEQIESWAEDTVQAEGFDYRVTASLGVTWIPEREYDGIYFPAGNYEALTLHIGEGTGQNWWCVLFPPLCLIDCGDNPDQASLEAVCGSRLVLRSRILELLEAGAKKKTAGSQNRK